MSCPKPHVYMAHCTNGSMDGGSSGEGNLKGVWALPFVTSVSLTAQNNGEQKLRHSDSDCCYDYICPIECIFDMQINVAHCRKKKLECFVRHGSRFHFRLFPWEAPKGHNERCDSPDDLDLTVNQAGDDLDWFQFLGMVRIPNRTWDFNSRTANVVSLQIEGLCPIIECIQCDELCGDNNCNPLSDDEAIPALDPDNDGIPNWFDCEMSCPEQEKPEACVSIDSPSGIQYASAESMRVPGNDVGIQVQQSNAQSDKSKAVTPQSDKAKKPEEKS